MKSLSRAAVIAAFASLVLWSQEPEVKLHRSLSGSPGERTAGKLTIESPRTKFTVPGDTEVVVYFEWEGPPGPYSITGKWIDPFGKSVDAPTAKATNKTGRFGVYWPVTLTESTAPGAWTLEAMVDGQPAGSHRIEVVAAARAESQQDIQDRLRAATVHIDKLGPGGEPFDTATGFLTSGGFIVTAFQAIDGAFSLRISYASGKAEKTDEILLWNRLQDWAILKGTPGKASLELEPAAADGARPALPSLPTGLRLPTPAERPSTDEWADFTSSLGPAAPGSVTFAGRREVPGFGERFDLKSAIPDRAAGAPILNPAGQVIAIAGGSLIPGLRSYSPAPSRLRVPPALRGKIFEATPVRLLPAKATWPSIPSYLGDLSANSEFLPPLGDIEALNSAIFTRKMDSKKKVGRSAAEQFEFSHSEGEINLSLSWFTGFDVPRRKAIASASLYGAAGNELTQIMNGPVEIHPNSDATLDIPIDVSKLSPGHYRVDYRLDGIPVWRGFFTITQ